MAENATLTIQGKTYDLPIVVGTEKEVGVDITKLRAQSGAITLDEAYGNTGSCESAITFINGEKGILRYRGYPIEQLAEHASFPEVAYLTIFGSCLAYGSYMWLIHHTTPARLATVAYVNPAVATVLGWWILDETLQGPQLLGMGVILIGVITVARK